MKSFLDTDERTAVFIDGAFMYQLTKAMDFSMDYAKLHNIFHSSCRLVNCFYYTKVVMDDNGFNRIQPLLDYLAYSNYKVEAIPCELRTDSNGCDRTNYSVDCQITVQALIMAERLDHVIFFARNENLAPVADALQNAGLRVTAVSTMKAKHLNCSETLRRAVGNFVEIDDLLPDILRDTTANNGTAGIAVGAQNGHK